LGPDQVRVFAAAPEAADRYQPRNLTPEPEGRIDDETLAVSPDGRLVAYGWFVPDGPDGRRQALVVAEAATGARSFVVDDGQGEFHGPVFSPDGRTLACS